MNTHLLLQIQESHPYSNLMWIAAAAKKDGLGSQLKDLFKLLIIKIQEVIKTIQLNPMEMKMLQVPHLMIMMLITLETQIPDKMQLGITLLLTILLDKHPNNHKLKPVQPWSR